MDDRSSGKLKAPGIIEITVISATAALFALVWLVYDRVIGTGGWRIYQGQFRQLQRDQLKLKLKNAESRQSTALKELAYAPINADFSGDESTLIDGLKRQVNEVKSRPAVIEEIVVSDLHGRHVDRCTTCHLGIERPEFSGASRLVFRAHPDLDGLLKHHPVAKLGCTTCHEGQGSDLDARHGPMLKGRMVESSCVRCHENAPLLKGASTAAEGALLYQSKGCYACHQVDGSPYLTANLGFVGPDLKGIRSKVQPPWLATWIRSPKKIHPRTMMPEFGIKNVGLPDQEAVQLASYLLKVSADAPLSAKAIAYGRTNQATPLTVARGKELFEKRGCLGCHDLDKNRTAAPRHSSLDGIGSKVSRQWLYSWIEDPQKMSASTLMPKFALKPDEIACLVDFLSTKRKDKLEYVECDSGDMTLQANIEAGKKLVGRYGCYNCHSIPGFENNNQKIGPALTDFGARDPIAFSWGKKKNVVPRKERNWYTWTIAKLKDPKVFETKRIKKIMPHYELTTQEIDKIVVFLKSLTGHQTVSNQNLGTIKPGQADSIAGRQLIFQYGCIGCHSMYDETARARSEDKSMHRLVRGGALAPNLSGTGARVRSDWLLAFLKKPYKMRPYLTTSMPNFHFRNRDDRTLVRYFQATGNSAAHFEREAQLERAETANAEAGKKLFAGHLCASCHQLNGRELPVASKLRWYHNMQVARRMAPDLADVKEKLHRDWVVRWIENPPLLMPDTTMPYMALTAEEAGALASYLDSAFPKTVSKTAN